MLIDTYPSEDVFARVPEVAAQTGQVRDVSKGDITGQVTFVARLFGVAA